MNVIRTIYQLALADFRERIRQYSFLVLLGITMLAAYFFVPPIEAGYVTLYLDGYRGVYNSAWVGGSVALSTTLLLTLFGFYLVKNSIQRDRRTGVGQIIASTSVKKLHYLMGKWLSNFVVLSIIVVVIILMAIIMQWVRGEVMQVQLWSLLSPFLFLTLPILSIVAALAVLFETRQVLQGVLGNVMYFILFLIFSTGSSYMPFGTAVVTSDMVNELSRLKPDFIGSYGIGVLVPEQPLVLYEWLGVDWTGALLLQQLSLFLFAFLLIIVSSLLFRGFQETSYLENTMSKNDPKGNTSEAVKNEALNGIELGMEGQHERTSSRISAAALPRVTVRESFLPLVLAEWRLMMKSASLGWYIVAVILAILCLVLPAAVSSKWMIWPVTWMWPLVFWSGIGNREERYQTQFLVASSPRFVIRQLSAVWVAGILLACSTGSGMLIRFILEGKMEHVAYWISAAILIPSLALASGVLTRTNRTFEVLYMIIWYLGPFNKMPVLDFMGTTSAEGSSWITDLGLNTWVMSLVYILLSVGFLIPAYVSRRHLARAS